MQGTQVQSLVQEDSSAMEQRSLARPPLNPACLEPVFFNKKSHGNEKPLHHTTMKTQHSQK